MPPQLEASPHSAALGGGRSRWSLLGSVLGPFLALVAVASFFALAEMATSDRSTFVSERNLRTILVQIAPVAVAAMGMTLIIIAGGIDLSAGTALALCSTVLALCLKNDVAPWLAIAATLGTGALCGLLNGALISYLRVVPFIVTLGTMTIFLGVAKILADSTTVRPDADTQVPQLMRNLLSIRSDYLWGEVKVNSHVLFSGLPLGVWLTMLLALALSLVLRYTVFSRYVFALGSNEATARLCGINVTFYKIAVYTVAGLFVGIAGLFHFTRLSSGEPTSGTGLELQIIAAVVIGGGSLNGGRGSVLGTLTGAAIMSVIGSGCTQLGLENPIQDIMLGVIIVLAVTVDQVRQRRLAA